MSADGMQVTATGDLVAFLRARLDEIEAAAHAAGEGTHGRWTASDDGRVELDRPWPPEADVFDYTIVFDEGSPSLEQASHIARHDPAHVLADVEAKRRIVEMALGAEDAVLATLDHGDALAEGMTRAVHATAVAAVKLLAVAYADHPDYREEWRP